MIHFKLYSITGLQNNSFLKLPTRNWPFLMKFGGLATLRSWN